MIPIWIKGFTGIPLKMEQKAGYLPRMVFWGLVLAGWTGSFAFPETALAGINTWTKAKFYYGHVYALAIDPQRPNTIYATVRHPDLSQNKVYKSTDGGTSWSDITPKDVYSINCLATDPQRANTVYVTAIFRGYPQISGIYKSTDGGTTWHNIGPRDMAVSPLAIDPQNPNTIYAGSIYKSTDGGATWNYIDIGRAKYYVSFLAIDPEHPNTIYAGTRFDSYTTFPGGIYKSTDGGATWSHIGPSRALISFIAIDPKHPSTIYAGTTYGGSGEPKDFSPGGIYKSTDGGATWSHIGPGGSNNIYPNIFSIAIDPYQTNILYVSTAAGLYKSTDGGISWSNIRRVVYDAIAIHPQQRNILYAGTRNIGIEMSTNGGSSWNNIGPVIPKVLSTVINPQQTNIIYAATEGGVYKSIDGGVSWEKIGRLGCDTGDIYYFIVIDPKTNTLYEGSNFGISKCNEAANSCRQISPFPLNPQGGPVAHSLAIDPQNSNTLYIGTGGNGIYKSIDGGISWKQIHKGNAYIIAIDPEQTDTLYVSRGDGVIKSTDGGTSWNKSGLEGFNISSLVIDPQKTNIVYAGTTSNGIYESTDGGNSWTALNNGLPTDVTIYSLAIDPKQTEIVYAGTNYGIYSIGFNNDPIAQAEADRVVATGSNVTLDGSSSSDPDGDSLSYSWTLLSKPEGSDISLSDTSSPSINFIPGKDGLYKFQLIVSDGQSQSSPDYVTVRALGQEDKVVLVTNKTQYQPGDTLELYIWVGNASSAPEVKADAFIGFGLPDEALYFFDSSLNLKPADPTDPHSFTPFAQHVTLSPGFVFPGSAEMNTDSDGNGKLDSYRLFSVILPPDLPTGPYFVFAALAEPGSAQSAFPQLFGPISLAHFSFTP